MTEKELNAYRFLSGEDPTYEMMERTMKEAVVSDMQRRREAEARIKAEVARQRARQKERLASRLNSLKNE